MRFLLDTHIALWRFTDSDKLPAKGIALLEKRGSELFVSIASIWEAKSVKNRNAQTASFIYNIKQGGCI